MKCVKCGNTQGWNFNEYDGDDGTEVICADCGSAYVLEYVGYYLEGSNDRIDIEDETQIQVCKSIKEERGR